MSMCEVCVLCIDTALSQTVGGISSTCSQVLSFSTLPDQLILQIIIQTTKLKSHYMCNRCQSDHFLYPKAGDIDSRTLIQPLGIYIVWGLF